MDTALLLGLLVLLCCFRALPGAFQDGSDAARRLTEFSSPAQAAESPRTRTTTQVSAQPAPCLALQWAPLLDLPGQAASPPGAQLVQCRMCHLQFPGEKCSRGRGLCVATMEEACITGKIFKKDGGLWLTFRGCLKNCANVSGIRWSIYSVTLWCCRGYDLCNEDL
ncbi:prostate and testis expressed protein 1 [Tupaia chinensis]|uniref:prostate and testis expressed protein 1 n=1 Tax=Tupaia chinensis TaxID=246437 RepID=UPI000FFBC34C|nr:prostate and testis expressed protein 1 [Tupaia chinensis]